MASSDNGDNMSPESVPFYSHDQEEALSQGQSDYRAMINHIVQNQIPNLPLGLSIFGPNDNIYRAYVSGSLHNAAALVNRPLTEEEARVIANAHAKKRWVRGFPHELNSEAGTID